MRPGILTTGKRVLVVNVKHFVSIDVFAVALRNHFFNEISYDLEMILSESFNKLHRFDDDVWEEQAAELVSSRNPFPKMTKARAQEILQDSLWRYGRQGQFEHGHFEASYERGTVFNRCGDLAIEFVKKKFPHLTQTD